MFTSGSSSAFSSTVPHGPAGRLTVDHSRAHMFVAGAPGTANAVSGLLARSLRNAGRIQSPVAEQPLLLTTGLTLQAQPAGVAPGGTTTLSGSLSFQDSADPTGLTVSLSEERPDASVADLGTVPADSAGQFQLVSEPLDQVGTYTFTASYAGDATHDPTTAETTVLVSTTATTLTLHAKRQAIIYGHSLKLTAQLIGVPDRSNVTLYAKTKHTKTIGTARTDTDGSVTFKVKPSRNTTYTASYAGTSTYQASTSPKVKIGVAPLIKAQLSRADSTRGGYRLFHYKESCTKSGSGCPSVSARLSPNLHRSNLYVVVQEHTRQGWQTAVVLRHRLDRHSKATFKLRYAKSARGPKFRMALVYNGGSKFTAAVYGFWYFRIIR